MAFVPGIMLAAAKYPRSTLKQSFSAACLAAFALGSLETSAKAHDQVQLFPGALKRSSPRMNAGAPTKEPLSCPALRTFFNRSRTTKFVRKNSGSGEKHTSEAKAYDDYMTFMPGIMLAAARYPQPTLRQSFSAACLAALALGFLESSAKAHGQVQLFPGALKRSSPRMNAGAPTKEPSAAQPYRPSSTDLARLKSCEIQNRVFPQPLQPTMIT
jgi:hypothetical protein